MAERTTIAAMAVAASLVAPTVHARAADEAPRVLVMPLSVDGELSEGWRDDFDARLDEGLGRSEAQLVRAADEQTCEDPACWQKLGRASEVDFIVAARLQVDERDFELRVELISAVSGQVVATAQQPCELCGLGEVSQVIVDASATVASRLATLATSSGVVRFDSIPAGATIVVDGTSLGTTPLSHELGPGQHSATASKREYVTQTRSFETAAGVDQTVRFDLQPQAKDPRALRATGWVLLGGGIAGLAAGTALIVIDERDVTSRCTGDNVNANGICKYRHDTLAGGIASLAIGAAALIAGTTIAIVTRPGRRNKRVALGPGSVRIRF